METDDKEAGKEPEAAGDKAEAAPAREPEPSSHKLDNPSRVVPTQQKFVALEPNSRWVPIHKNRPIAGIIVLKDLRPGGPLMQPSNSVQLEHPMATMQQGTHASVVGAAKGIRRWFCASVDVLKAAVLRRGAGGPADKYQHYASGSRWPGATQWTECITHTRQLSRARAARAIRCALQALIRLWEGVLFGVLLADVHLHVF